MIQRSENVLVKRILEGNHEACLELIAHYHAPIYRLLVHLCRDAHLAEDLAQESFLAAWKSMASFNGKSSLNTWLHRIAYRKFIDAHRRESRSVAVQAEASVERVQATSPTPYEHALATDQQQQLYWALDQLSPEQREVLVLHYLQGLSYEETATVLGQPSGTTKWRTGQALENLRRQLKGSGEI